MKYYFIRYNEAGKVDDEIVEANSAEQAIHDLNNAWPLPVEPLEILNVSAHDTLDAAIAERNARKAKEAQPTEKPECDPIEELYLWECEMNDIDPNTPDYRNQCMDRFRNIKAMHEIIQSMNDEAAYCRWIYTVPDCAGDDDFMFIACDEESFSHCVKLFKHLYSSYIASGLYIGGQLY